MAVHASRGRQPSDCTFVLLPAESISRLPVNYNCLLSYFIVNYLNEKKLEIARHGSAHKYIHICSERQGSHCNNRNPSNRSIRKKKKRSGVLPAVRHLTVTLSSRELRRFRLVLLLISNECSSFVVGIYTATNLRVCASASFLRPPFIFFSVAFCFLFSFSISFSPFDHHDIELLSSFYFRQSRPPLERDCSLARSLA